MSLGDDLNAWADGRNIVVTARMMRFAATDDELAFVVAHEMAHNLLGHAAKLRSFTALFGSHSKRKASCVKGLEIDADVLAVTLLAHAHFDPEASMPFIVRSMRGLKDASSTHPGILARLEAIRNAVGAQRLQLTDNKRDSGVKPFSQARVERSRRAEPAASKKGRLNAG